VFSCLGKINEVESLIPSYMKHISTFGVKTYSSLKVKRCTLFVTGYETSSSLEERAKEEEQAYSNHDTF